MNEIYLERGIEGKSYGTRKVFNDEQVDVGLGSTQDHISIISVSCQRLNLYVIGGPKNRKLWDDKPDASTAWEIIGKSFTPKIIKSALDHIYKQGEESGRSKLQSEIYDLLHY